jgi:hypothetical protein
VNSAQSASTCASLRTHELAEVAARLSFLKGGATTLPLRDPNLYTALQLRL